MDNFGHLDHHGPYAILDLWSALPGLDCRNRLDRAAGPDGL